MIARQKNSVGNVGMGTMNPVANLDISGAVRAGAGTTGLSGLDVAGTGCYHYLYVILA